MGDGRAGNHDIVLTIPCRTAVRFRTDRYKRQQDPSYLNTIYIPEVQAVMRRLEVGDFIG
jgi:hypothetical protein